MPVEVTNMAVVDSFSRVFHHVRSSSQQMQTREARLNEAREAGSFDQKSLDKEEKQDHDYSPPTGPPPSQKEPLPLRGIELPLISPDHRFNLSAQGWTTVTLPKSKPEALPLRDSIQVLFAAGRTFFAREEEYKAQFQTQLDSEEGYSSIPGEKQFITIRSLDRVPDELREAAITAWAQLGGYLGGMLGQIEQSLEIGPDSLTKFSTPCINLHKYRTATMLRIFRYEGWEDKIVAEPHNDLGLLSLVAGDAPGLEVWNGMTRKFFPIEKSYKDLSSSATVLVGRQLQRLSNGRYVPGAHQVKSYPKSKSKKLFKPDQGVGKRFRYSIVFVLRAHEDVIVDVKSLTSPITGVPGMVRDGMPAKEMFDAIRNSHYNINTGIHKREEQKKRIQATNAPATIATHEPKAK